MIERIHRIGPAFWAVIFAVIPLFPGFITFTTVQYPGVSIVPLPVALGVIALALLLSAYGTIQLFNGITEPVPLKIPLLAWVGAFAFATIAGLNPRDGMIFVVILLLGVLWHVSICREWNVPGVARASLWAIVLSGTLSCVLAVTMVLTRTPAALYAIANGRAVGTFVLPGELAGYLIVFIPLTYALARTAQSKALRALSWVGFALGLVTMFLTFSRTGWVGLSAAAAVFVALRARERGRGRGLVTAGAIVAGALMLVLMLFNEHHNPSENYTRISIWQAAIGVIERFPLTGVGAFGFSRIYPLVRLPGGDETAFHAHSMYLTFLAELGIIGFAAFVWVVAAAVRELIRRMRTASPRHATLALAIAAGLAGTLVQGLIDTVSVVIFGLFFPMLAMMLAAARYGAVDA